MRNNISYFPLYICHVYDIDKKLISRKWKHITHHHTVIEKSINCINAFKLISDLYKCFYYTGNYLDIGNTKLYSEIFNTPNNYLIYNIKKNKVYNLPTYYHIFSKFGCYGKTDIEINGTKVKIYKYPKNLILKFNKKTGLVECKI